MNGSNEKTKTKIKAIPEPTLRRLPLYYQYLKKIQLHIFKMKAALMEQNLMEQK